MQQGTSSPCFPRILQFSGFGVCDRCSSGYRILRGGWITLSISSPIFIDRVMSLIKFVAHTVHGSSFLGETIHFSNSFVLHEFTSRTTDKAQLWSTSLFVEKVQLRSGSRHLSQGVKANEASLTTLCFPSRLFTEQVVPLTMPEVHLLFESWYTWRRTPPFSYLHLQPTDNGYRHGLATGFHLPDPYIQERSSPTMVAIQLGSPNRGTSQMSSRDRFSSTDVHAPSRSGSSPTQLHITPAPLPSLSARRTFRAYLERGYTRTHIYPRVVDPTHTHKIHRFFMATHTFVRHNECRRMARTQRRSKVDG